MKDEYSYSGECDPTPCPCGVIHPWEYNLEQSSAGEEGCYVCLGECDWCPKVVFRTDLVKYCGCDVCQECKEQAEKEERMVRRVVLELAA